MIHRIGKAKAGPFKVLWERWDTENGNYVLACPACTETITGADAGTGLLPTPRSFNNCSGMK